MANDRRRLAWAAAYVATGVVLALLASALFRAYLLRSDLDHGRHLVYAQQLVARGALQPHFGYHLLVALASLWSTDLARLDVAANVLLTLLVLARLAVALAFLQALCAQAGAPLRPGVGLALTVAFFFVAPLPNWWRPPNVYFGQISPTVWHNPTVITLAPLAIAAFWAFVRADPAAPGPDDRPAGALMALSSLAKPNFVLAFLPAAVLVRLLARPRFRSLAWLAGPTLAVLAGQLAHARSLSPASGSTLLEIQPLFVWKAFSPHPAFSVLVSLAFPLAVLAFAWSDRRHARTLAVAWFALGVAVLQFALFAEPGERLWDGNYYWGVVPTSFLVFLVSVAELLAPRSLPRPRRAARALCWLLLALHVAGGVILYAWPFQLAVVD